MRRARAVCWVRGERRGGRARRGRGAPRGRFARTPAPCPPLYLARDARDAPVAGARIWHAAAALGCGLGELVADADSLSVCLSKALGAPAGSLVVGSRALVGRGLRLRKSLGGGMRQVGVLAAAGMVSLDEVLPHVSQDHARAQTLARGIAAAGLEVEHTETNIVFFSVDSAAQGLSAAQLVGAAGRQGVHFLEIGGGRMRCVTHHQVDDERVERAIHAIRTAVERPELASAARGGAYARGGAAPESGSGTP